MKAFSALLFASPLLSSVLAAGSMCYFPDGVTPSPEDIPCNPDAQYSACCGRQADNSSAFCLANGLCLSDFKISRGSCTDKSWKSPNCAQQCQTSNPKGGMKLNDCGGNILWSCDDCKKDSFPVNTDLMFNAALKSSLGITDNTNSSSANSSSDSCPSTGSSVQQVASGNSDNNSGPSATAVGAGVGVSLGCAFIAALILFLLEKRKNRQLRAGLGGPGSSYHNLVEQQPYPLQKGAAYGYAPSSVPVNNVPRNPKHVNELPGGQPQALELQGTPR